MFKKYLDILKQYNEVAARVHHVCGKSKFSITCDMLYCSLRYLASHNNYEKFEFYNLNHRQRSTFVTHGLSEKMIRRFNVNEYRDIFEDKIEFAKKFNEFFGREWISSKCTFDEFSSFIKNKEKIVYKPLFAAQGNGIKVLKSNDRDIKTMYDEIKTYPDGIIEDWIKQHEDIANIYPDAVNCLRIITVCKDGKIYLLTGGITIPIKDEIANLSLDCIVAPVDMNTGKVNKPAAAFGSKLYEKHPITNAQIIGFQVPFWKEIQEMLSKAGNLVPEVSYVGWDIAITPDGPILIEGNTSPGYRYYQIPAHVGKKGNREVYEQFFK